MAILEVNFCHFLVHTVNKENVNFSPCMEYFHMGISSYFIDCTEGRVYETFSKLWHDRKYINSALCRAIKLRESYEDTKIAQPYMRLCQYQCSQ